jgi:hypothetical protein
MKTKSTAKKQSVKMKDLTAKKSPKGGFTLGGVTTTKTSTAPTSTAIFDRWGNL